MGTKGPYPPLPGYKNKIWRKKKETQCKSNWESDWGVHLQFIPTEKAPPSIYQPMCVRTHMWWHNILESGLFERINSKICYIVLCSFKYNKQISLSGTKASPIPMTSILRICALQLYMTTAHVLAEYLPYQGSTRTKLLPPQQMPSNKLHPPSPSSYFHNQLFTITITIRSLSGTPSLVPSSSTSNIESSLYYLLMY